MTTRQRTFARALRQRQTSAEELLWQALRARRLEGRKFRRQVPIGPYVVDFVCSDARLIVEVDGRQHEAEVAYDEQRTADLEAQGFVVIRCTNADVRDWLDTVLARISAALRRE